MKRFLQMRWVGALGRGTVFTAVGLVLRALLQAAYLVLVSRWLGAAGYGLFAGSVAAAVLFAPLAAAGLGLVFTERLTHQGESARTLWPRIASQTLLSGVVVGLLVLMLVAALLPVRVSMTSMALLVAGELVALPLVHNATAALIAQGRVKLAAVATNSVPAARLAAAGLLLLAGVSAKVSVLAASHCVGTIVAAAWALFATRRVAWQFSGTNRTESPKRLALITEGVPYAFGAMAGTSYAEIDKVLVLQWLGAGVAGAYTAAYRVVSVLVLPVSALLTNALPRLFAARRAGNYRQVLKSVFIASFGYSLLGGLLAWFVAPWLPRIFGDDYASASHYMALLSLWVPLAALHLTGANALMALGGKKSRMYVEASGLLLVAGLDVWLLPIRGAEGAVFALIAAELFMALGCWLLCRRNMSRQARSPG